MALISEDQIASIVDKVVSQIAKPSKVGNERSTDLSGAGTLSSAHIYATPNNSVTGTIGCFADINSAIDAAERAFFAYKAISVEQRKKIIAAIRELCQENVKQLARMAVDETGMGRYPDKIRKNELAINRTPGVEDLEPRSFTGDKGLTLIEQAPWGVIGSITPSTNPSETIINNTIGMVAGGNAVVFNPHPGAKKISAFTVSLINKAIISAGGPPNLITTVSNPTIASANILMKHPKIALLVVTGGPAVVASAMNSGKRVIAAGPGNPPTLVDESADLEQAAKDIITSASTDNNIICVVEKNIIAHKNIADNFKKILAKNGAFELNNLQTKRLEKVIINGDGTPNKKWVGKDIQVILKEIDINLDQSYRMAFAETDARHPFAKLELLMPVLPYIRTNCVDEGIEIAYELEERCFHTASIHSRNIDNLHKMAVKMNTAIFVKNGPTLAGLGLGGEGPATFTIAAPTGEGITTARHFTRFRRCVVTGHFRIV